MEKIFTVICERGISAGYVILAVIVLRLLFRKSPRWVMGILWALVAIRLICPIVVGSPFSVVPKGPLFDKETSNLKSEQEVQQINNLPCAIVKDITMAKAEILISKTSFPECYEFTINK